MNGIAVVGDDAMVLSGAVGRQAAPERGAVIDGEATVARGLLHRDELLERLERAVAKRVTLISAPPGSGKTSLLTTWAHRAAGPRRIVFVPVERNQQDAPAFWHAVRDAVRLPALSIKAQTQPSASSAIDEDDLVDTILSQLAEQTEGIVLIIDDLHELRSAEALAQIERLLGRLPSSASVVLSSRRDPLIRLHQLRLADELAEIRFGDLRFTQRETREMLVRSEVDLSDDGAAALYRRTEGWAAGLRLAVISLSGHPDPERFVDEFSGTDRAIGDYLMAEMLERQPREAQNMLLRTSLVDRPNGQLADLLAGRSGSDQVLLELEEANAFVVSLDARRTWFRYHHLLADFLRLELRRTFADELPDLHRRAAQWFADQGEMVEAIRHSLAAGDWPDAARLLADHSFSLTLDGNEGTIGKLLRSFPAGAVADHPDLALAHAATQLAQGRLEEAAAQLALAEAHVQSAPVARRRRLKVEIASLRLALARRSGQFTEVIARASQLAASTADESSEAIAMGTELRAVALMNLGIVETWNGRFADAERHLAEGVALAQTIGRPYLEVACRAHQGFPSPLVSVAAARERGREAVELAERHGWGDRPILAAALAAVAGMAIWTGDFDEGERWLQRAWKLLEAGVDPAATVQLHVVRGMLYAGRGQQQAALEEFTAAAQAQLLLSGVHALAPRIAGWLAATQARIGMLDEARATLAGFCGEPERMGAVHNAQAVICIAEGDPAAAVEVLRERRDLTAPVGPALTLVEAHLLAGTAHLALGDRSEAADAAEAALAAAESDRLIFPFAMTGATELLDILPRHNTAHGALLADIFEVLRGGSAASAGSESGVPPQDLSVTELRVLRYLPTNMTRVEIAHELYVSVNTVNTHLRSIYSKLDARDRSTAVRRARHLRLLSAGRWRT